MSYTLSRLKWKERKQGLVGLPLRKKPKTAWILIPKQGRYMLELVEALKAHRGTCSINYLFVTHRW